MGSDLQGEKQMNQVREKPKKVLYLPRCFENVPLVPKVNANVLLHGYAGGIRHEPIDIASALMRFGFGVNNTGFGYIVSRENEDGEVDCFAGSTLIDVLHEVKDEDLKCKTLYHQVCRDPLEQTREVVPDEHRETQLTVSRIYRKLLGQAVDLVSKWAQSERFGDGYVAFKFSVETTEDVYHVGAGNWLGQTFRGIKTTGTVRCVDPQRDTTRIEKYPRESVCVSDCSYSDGMGMSNVAYFYQFYEQWIKDDKKVYFKGDLCNPPKFPCVVLERENSRKHNREFLGYADNTITTYPDFKVERELMSKANAVRNLKATEGTVNFPEFDKERVEMLLCDTVGYNIKTPKVVNMERKVCSRARFPITLEAFSWRCKSKLAAAPYSGITNSVIVWLFEQIEFLDFDKVEIDLLTYPLFENHQFVEECLWSFEECSARLGLYRSGSRLLGTVSSDSHKNFTRLMEKSAARH